MSGNESGRRRALSLADTSERLVSVFVLLRADVETVSFGTIANRAIMITGPADPVRWARRISRGEREAIAWVRAADARAAAKALAEDPSVLDVRVEGI